MSKKIPSFQKDMKHSLTSETKKILAVPLLVLGAANLSNVETTSAAHSNTWSPALPVSDTSVSNGTRLVITGPATCNHASGIVNGHFSNIPSVNYQPSTTYTHSSHSSSGSGGGGGWC